MNEMPRMGNHFSPRKLLLLRNYLFAHKCKWLTKGDNRIYLSRKAFQSLANRILTINVPIDTDFLNKKGKLLISKS
jgi:hypothetical protein